MYALFEAKKGFKLSLLNTCSHTQDQQWKLLEFMKCEISHALEYEMGLFSEGF